MNDLISRKALNEAISYALYSSIRLDVSDIRNIINNQPTAYDVDKVVEQLKECERYVYDAVSDEDNYVIDTEKAIEIVKGAVKDE